MRARGRAAHDVAPFTRKVKLSGATNVMPANDLMTLFSGQLPFLGSRQRIAGALVLFDPALQETLPVLFEFMGVGDPKRPSPKAPPPYDSPQ